MAKIRQRWLRFSWVSLVALVMASCAVPPERRAPSKGHLGTEPAAAAAPEIPEPVRRTPFLPPPKPTPPVETYTVVVAEVPVKELLFALARDAALNVDIHPNIEGTVTLNAVDQTLQQILQRISGQVDVRYEVKDDILVVAPDTPFLKTYKVDYVNIARDTETTVSISTEVATGGEVEGAGGGGGGAGGESESSTDVKNVSKHHFWARLKSNIEAMIADEEGIIPNSVISHPESGVLVVRATAKQHEQIRAYVDQVLVNARREVLIEATIVEVELNDTYQAGVDWKRILETTASGVAVTQSFIGGGIPSTDVRPAFFELFFRNDRDGEQSLELTVRLLQEFGNTSVLSSPRLMVLNNQTAVLKVVDNEVYFTVEVERDTTSGSDIVTRTFETEVHTVPVGLVMNVTPQISDSDTVTLSVRPTISRIKSFANDPNPELANANITNPIPEIQVREMESVLRLSDGDIAVLGGLMQDSIRDTDDGVPLLSQIDGIGELFKFRDDRTTKTELVIFLRPRVVRDPSIETDLASFEQFLPENLPKAEPMKIPVQEYLP